MATSIHASTPPPPSSIHTPTTPRFGWDDSYEPYSSRKSNRVSSQRSRVAQTPPPQSSGHNLRTNRSPRSSKKSASSMDIATSPPSSPQTAPKKRAPRLSAVMGGRRVSGALNDDNTATAAAALGLPVPRKESKTESHQSATTVRNTGMLPTPAKTPKKRPSEVAPGISSIARNIFPVHPETVEEVMPTPKKTRKRYTGLSLDSFTAEGEQSTPIQIYTDSNDRVPEADLSTDNPFYGQGTTAYPEPTKRTSKRRKINVPGEGEQTVEEAERREDGLVYVFRGKKIFRKFGNDEAEQIQDSDGVNDELEASVPRRLRGPLTRSSIKPRLLFPTPLQSKAKEARSQATEDEEEAITDIEEPPVTTPVDHHIDEAAVTPMAPKFAPFSPPTTARATRSKRLDLASSPVTSTSDDESTFSATARGKGAKNILKIKDIGLGRNQSQDAYFSKFPRLESYFAAINKNVQIVNDDGPPSNQSSPYVHSLVRSLQDAGHVVSVVLPHVQRSWIGKAHIIGQTVKPTYFRPGTLYKDDGTTHSHPLPAGSEEQEEWVLVDGTPASCVQIGLYHYFQNRGAVDLVVSGPNYGRNSTAVFSLSSGTLGGALEAAVCKRKAIALSYAFFSRNHDPQIIAGASKLSVRLIEYLYKNWDSNVDLYTINVPLLEDVDQKRIMWTNVLQNYWEEGSCFQEVEDEEWDADEEEESIREREGAPRGDTNGESVTRHKHKHFKWAPRFADVYRSVDKAGPGNDGWAVKEGYTSVTPLKANFMHAAAVTQGELKLPSNPISTMDSLSLSDSQAKIYIYVNYEDDYVQPLILSALKSRLPANTYQLLISPSELPTPTSLYLHIGAYETLPFTHIMSHPSTSLTNAYMIRKALIRKHYLSTTTFNWITKHPSSILSTNIKPACDFELDYAEFLDDALVEAWELQESFGNNEGKSKEDREWWILKPGMSDRGQGIRLFSTEEELQAIFEEWEAGRPDSDDDEEEKGEGMGEDMSIGQKEPTKGDKGEEDGGDYIITSHLRHFIAQPYIHPPLLLPSNSRKFHIRTYVLALGALKIYVYKPMLALFASTTYIPPWSPASNTDLSPHLTNTCLQSNGAHSSVHLLSSLPISAALHTEILDQIYGVTGEVFEAAAKGMMIHFQTLPNVFEVFGLDFLVDEKGKAYLLEINAFPDFRQTGGELRDLVGGLWEGVVEIAVGGFFGVNVMGRAEGKREKGSMVLVREIDLGRR
ncbi:hypothetical protein B7494_g4498 [Chlorociboria aeruginascens]|nr:hypothetical protein B7494_g4498 [Chlorociboria aeruginascens]